MHTLRALAVIASLALRDLARRWRMMLALGTMVTLTVLSVTLLHGYTHSIEVRFRSAQPRLVVQQDSTVGEFAGSRIPAAVGDALLAAGVSEAIPEVHAVTGTSGADAMLVAGVDPDRYRDLDPYRIVSGRHLRSGESQRTAIVGVALARRSGVGVGDTLRVRGRDFLVVGVFELGTYLEDGVVVPIADAQRLLGWGSDVSLYVIPEDGPYRAGDTLPGGLLVGQRGDVALVDEWGPLLALLTTSVWLLAAGAVAVLAVALWRLAWIHRVDLGLLRLVGLPRRALVVFLGVQAVALVAVSAAAGLVLAVALAPRMARTTLAVTTAPVIDDWVLTRAAGDAMLIVVVALAVPLVAVARRSVSTLVRRDD